MGMKQLPVTLQQQHDRHRLATIRQGGCFKHEPTGRMIRGAQVLRLAVGSGGATCYPPGVFGRLFAMAHGWSMAVHLCRGRWVSAYDQPTTCWVPLFMGFAPQTGKASCRSS